MLEEPQTEETIFEGKHPTISSFLLRNFFFVIVMCGLSWGVIVVISRHRRRKIQYFISLEGGIDFFIASYHDKGSGKNEKHVWETGKGGPTTHISLYLSVIVRGAWTLLKLLSKERSSISFKF